MEKDAAPTNIASIAKPRMSAQISLMSEVEPFTSSEFEALKIVHSGEEGSRHLKVYRGLRTQLMKRANRKAFTCLVVSVASGGGSYVATNLAAIISLDKTKTSLFVDANLYAPYAECLLPIASQAGLTDYLEDPSLGVEDIVYASGITRMRVIPAGNNKEGGTEKIHSSRMKSLFKEIKNRYSDRYIIVDGPPISEYDAEISILADLCDFVILVVPYGKVTDVQLKSAIDKIGKEKLSGIVYNRG